MNQKKGFTLIELLVVIAIIALLMSVIMPALSKVKEQAGTVVCKSKLANFGKAFAAYAIDNDDHFPMNGQRSSSGDLTVWGGGYPVGPYWDGRILSYLYPEYSVLDSSANQKAELENAGLSQDSMKIFKCVSSKWDEDSKYWDEQITNWTALTAVRTANPYPRSYRMNGLLGGHADEHRLYTGTEFTEKAYLNSLRTSQVSNSANTFLVIDGKISDGSCFNTIYNWAARDFFDIKTAHKVKWNGQTFADTWHKDGSAKSTIGITNALMADGHVEHFIRYYTPDTDDNGEAYWSAGHPDNKYRYKFTAR